MHFLVQLTNNLALETYLKCGPQKSNSTTSTAPKEENRILAWKTKPPQKKNRADCNLTWNFCRRLSSFLRPGGSAAKSAMIPQVCTLHNSESAINYCQLYTLRPAMIPSRSQQSTHKSAKPTVSAHRTYHTTGKLQWHREFEASPKLSDRGQD